SRGSHAGYSIYALAVGPGLVGLGRWAGTLGPGLLRRGCWGAWSAPVAGYRTSGSPAIHFGSRLDRRVDEATVIETVTAVTRSVMPAITGSISCGFTASLTKQASHEPSQRLAGNSRRDHDGCDRACGGPARSLLMRSSGVTPRRVLHEGLNGQGTA